MANNKHFWPSKSMQAARLFEPRESESRIPKPVLESSGPKLTKRNQMKRNETKTKRNVNLADSMKLIRRPRDQFQSPAGLLLISVRLCRRQELQNNQTVSTCSPFEPFAARFWARGQACVFAFGWPLAAARQGWLVNHRRARLARLGLSSTDSRASEAMSIDSTDSFIGRLRCSNAACLSTCLQLLVALL